MTYTHSAYLIKELQIIIEGLKFHSFLYTQNIWRLENMFHIGYRVFLSFTICGLFIWNTTAFGAPPADTNEYLDMDISQLMDITITSLSKKPQNLSEAAAAVYVISNEDIRSSGVTSIPEALALAPGLQVARISSSKWAISCRGFAGYTSNKLLVLIDGRSVYSPAYSGTFWDMQNSFLEDVDRIEVIRGPGGTVWGANAVNGVINIITKKASETQGTVIVAGTGNKENFLGGGRYGSQLTDSTYGRFSLTYNDRDSNVLFDDERNSGDGWQHVQGSFRFDGTPANRTHWTLQGDLFKNKEDQILFPYWIDVPPYLTEINDTVDVKGGNILGRYQYNFSADRNLTLQAYYDYSDREEGYYQQTFNIIDLDLQYQTLIAESNSLTMGVGYRRTGGDFTESYQVAIQDRTDNLYSAFLQDEVEVIDSRLWLTIGTKLENNEYTGTEWQPSARILYSPKPNHSAWAAVARAVRTPSMTENGGRVTVASFPTEYGTMRSRIVGSESFDSEKLIAYEAGYRFQSLKNFSFDIAFFYNDYSDIYEINELRTSTGTDLVFENGGSGSSKGTELVVAWRPNKFFSLEATYSYLDMDFTIGEETEDTNVTFDFIGSASPQNIVSMRSSIALYENWKCNLWLRYIDEITTRNSVNLLDEQREQEDYILIDINLVWSPTANIEFMLAGQNILEDEQLQYASEYVTPATAIERSFYGKLTYRF